MSYGYIYVVENKINGKLYVGQTTDPTKREEAHRYGYSQCPALGSAVDKYGRDNFDFVLLEAGSSSEELNRREIYWIGELRTLAPGGYNLREGGECGGLPSVETKEKISKNRKGKLMGQDNPMYGRSLTAQHKEKIGKANRGKTAGENNPWFGKFGSAHPRHGIPQSEESRQKIREKLSGANNPSHGRKGKDAFHFGKKHSVQSREKMSESLKKAWAEGKYKNRKIRRGSE